MFNFYIIKYDMKYLRREPELAVYFETIALKGGKIK